MRSQVKILEQLLDKNLRAAKQALGIEAIINVEEQPEQEAKKIQVQLKLELTNNEVRKNIVARKNRQEELMANKQY